MGSIRPIAIAVIARPTDVRCWSSTAAFRSERNPEGPRLVPDGLEALLCR